jgi:hypothetical protein
VLAAAETKNNANKGNITFSHPKFLATAFSHFIGLTPSVWVNSACGSRANAGTASTVN